jgi:hypothetical protein
MMPTLREFLSVLCGDSHDVAELDRRARELWPASNVYIPQHASRKVASNPGTRAAIVTAARSDGIVVAARRYGITRRHVRRLMGRG